MTATLPGMARITTVVVECDMPHTSPQSPAESFELYSVAAGRYAVDLCDACAAKLVVPLMANGTRTAAPRAARKRATRKRTVA